MTVLSATPLPADLNVTPFGSTGITFSGSFIAPAGATLPVDYAFSYEVTALSGSITGANLSGVYNIIGSSGTVSVGESLVNPVTNTGIGSLTISNPVISAPPISFAGVPAGTHDPGCIRTSA